MSLKKRLLLYLLDAHLEVHLAVDRVHAAVEGAGDVAAEELLVRAQVALERPCNNKRRRR